MNCCQLFGTWLFEFDHAYSVLLGSPYTFTLLLNVTLSDLSVYEILYVPLFGLNAIDVTVTVASTVCVVLSWFVTVHFIVAFPALFPVTLTFTSFPFELTVAIELFEDSNFMFLKSFPPSNVAFNVAVSPCFIIAPIRLTFVTGFTILFTIINF